MVKFFIIKKNNALSREQSIRLYVSTKVEEIIVVFIDNLRFLGKNYIKV
jgi:hypothetical protein